MATTSSNEVDDLVMEYVGLARSLARRFTGRGEPREDLDQVAYLALLGAARRYDPERGVSFATFATASVLGELKRHFRDRTWMVRPPRRLHDRFLQVCEARDSLHHDLHRSPTIQEIGERVGCSVEEVLEATEAGDGQRSRSLDATDQATGRSFVDQLAGDDGGLEGQLDRLQLERDLHILSDEERHILNGYYFQERTQLEIANELRCSQMQVSRILARTLSRLRHRAAAVD